MELVSSEAIEARECPDCRGFIFRPGPRGGLAQNVECVGCGARFSFTMLLGHIVFAQRIDHAGDWREDLFPKVLQ